MADIYMHSRLAEEVIKDIEYDFNKKIVFNAAQGPDPLYYNFFSKNHLEYRTYADRMHDTTTDLLFKNMVNYVKENTNIDTYSFLVGFICHYALDVKIHPYIYHNVGVYKKNDKSTHSYRGLHLKFERAVDAVLIQDDLSIKPNKIKLRKKQLPLNFAPHSVMRLMDYVLKETYGKDHGGVMYLIGTVEMAKIVKRFVTDKFGFKKLIFKFIDLFNKEQDLFFQDMSLYNAIEKYDYLNKEKNTWNHPNTNEEYCYSVMELYDQAVILASDLIEKVRLYIFENDEIDLGKVFTNLSFNSGLPCDHKQPMQYFNIYRK